MILPGARSKEPVDVVVRPVRLEDEDVFIELSIGLSMFNRSARDFGPLETHLAQRAKRCRETLRNSDEKQLVLIGEASGHALGYIICNYYESRDQLVGYIDELYVKEESRGLGVGKKLYQASVDWMKAKGVSRVTLNVFTHNRNAISFYEKEGFTPYAVSMERKI